MIKTVLDFSEKKNNKSKISMVTCYDFSFARAVAKSSIDCILVGDSIMMTIYGEKDTLSATPEILARHTRAVRLGAPEKFIVTDMPFMADRGSLQFMVRSAALLLQNGAQAIKIEGAKGLNRIRHLVDSGVPVMGHLGLTPQSHNSLGGFKVQAKNQAAQLQLLKDARALQDHGCFALVLESVPSSIATQVSEALEIPVIGIGAGSQVDGQVLVLQDLLGLNDQFRPKFVRRFSQLDQTTVDSLNAFHSAVDSGSFPAEKESYL